MPGGPFISGGPGGGPQRLVERRNPPVPFTRQVRWRARPDDLVALNSGTFDFVSNANWTQATDRTCRVRIQVDETAGAPGVVSGQLEANLNGGAWQDVTTSSTIVKAVVSSQFNDGDATTAVLGTSAGAPSEFVPGEGSEDGAASAVTLSFQQSQFEYAFQIVDADVTPGDAIRLRVKGLDTFTAPVITAAKSVPQGGAVASGNGPVAIIDTPQGGAVANGLAPTARTSAPQGGATADGRTPAPQVSVTQGGATAGGLTPSAASTAPQGGANAQGLGGTVFVPVAQGGALAGGFPPAAPGAPEVPPPGGAIAGGQTPLVLVPLVLGGAVVGGYGPTVLVAVIPGGAVAGGAAPTPPTPTAPEEWVMHTDSDWTSAAGAEWPQTGGEVWVTTGGEEWPQTSDQEWD